MQKTRLESNVNENIIQEEIQILTEMLLKATQKLISEETFQSTAVEVEATFLIYERKE